MSFQNCLTPSLCLLVLLLSASVSAQDKQLSDAQTFYNISGVPTMVLVDKEGKIIATGMAARGVTLKNKLAEIFR